MRKLQCVQIPGTSAQDILDEFNERSAEFGITNEADIISVSVLPATTSVPLHTSKGSELPTVEVVIVYWVH